MMRTSLTKSLQAPTPWNNLNMRTPIAVLLIFGVFLLLAPLANASPPLTEHEARVKLRNSPYEVRRIYKCTPRPSHWKCIAEIGYYAEQGEEVEPGKIRIDKVWVEWFPTYTLIYPHRIKLGSYYLTIPEGFVE